MTSSGSYVESWKKVEFANQAYLKKTEDEEDNEAAHRGDGWEPVGFDRHARDAHARYHRRDHVGLHEVEEAVAVRDNAVRQEGQHEVWFDLIALRRVEGALRRVRRREPGEGPWDNVYVLHELVEGRRPLALGGHCQRGVVGPIETALEWKLCIWVS